MNGTWVELLAFFHDALLVAMVAGFLLGALGVFLHLRRSLFLGAALPQVAGLGFILAMAAHLPPWLGALGVVFGFVGLLAWQGAEEAGGCTAEAVIGLSFVTAMAVSVLVTALTGTETHGLELLLKGSVLTSTCQDLHRLVGIGLPWLLVLFLLRRRLVLISLDPEMARTLGIPVRPYEVGLFFGASVAIVLTLQAAGAMACFGLLLLPGLGALAVAGTIRGVFAWAAALGTIGAVGGVGIALAWDLPAGPTMVVTSLGLTLICRWAGRRQPPLFLRPGNGGSRPAA